MTERFYCTCCGKQRLLEDMREVSVKRRSGYVKVKRCASCVARSKLTPEQRHALGVQDRKDDAAAKKYARDSSVEAPDV